MKSIFSLFLSVIFSAVLFAQKNTSCDKFKEGNFEVVAKNTKELLKSIKEGDFKNNFAEKTSNVMEMLVWDIESKDYSIVKNKIRYYRTFDGTNFKPFGLNSQECSETLIWKVKWINSCEYVMKLITVKKRGDKNCAFSLYKKGEKINVKIDYVTDSTFIRTFTAPNGTASYKLIKKLKYSAYFKN